MKIAIIGSGAVGLFYGAELQRAGNELHFLMRSDLATARSSGVTVRKADEQYTLDPVNAHESTETMGSCDLVVIALKTTANGSLPELLAPLVGKRTILLTLQNGLGNGELLQSLYPDNPVLGGLCFVCLNRLQPASVTNFLPGAVVIGPCRDAYLGEAERVVKAFQGATVKTKLEEDLKLAQWKKLMWNIPFNGLTIALGGRTTEDVLASESITREARQLMDEVQRGARCLGMEIDDAFLDLQIERTRPMGGYRPSSMIDYVEGRAVEVESIWGEPLRRAEAAGARLPRLALLYALLRTLCPGEPHPNGR